jgi:DNA end-binding protein Ku
MSPRWNPAQFKDTSRTDLMRRIREKIRKKQTHNLAADEPAALDRPKAQVIDLMDALRNSLKTGGKKAGSGDARSAKARKRA